MNLKRWQRIIGAGCLIILVAVGYELWSGWATTVQPIGSPPDAATVQQLATERGWYYVTTGVPLADGRPAQVYLSTVPLNKEQISGLRKFPDRTHEWKGIVECSAVWSGSSAADNSRLWGSYGGRAPGYSLYGDPEMLPEVAASLTNAASHR